MRDVLLWGLVCVTAVAIVAQLVLFVVAWRDDRWRKAERRDSALVDP